MVGSKKMMLAQESWQYEIFYNNNFHCKTSWVQNQWYEPKLLQNWSAHVVTSSHLINNIWSKNVYSFGEKQLFSWCLQKLHSIWVILSIRLFAVPAPAAALGLYFEWRQLSKSLADRAAQPGLSPGLCYNLHQ